jgi:large subunit ribosomal protein L28
MGKVCQVTGRIPEDPPLPGPDGRPSYPGVQRHRFWVPDENRFVRLRVSAEGIRIIKQRGITAVLADIRARGEQV